MGTDITGAVSEPCGQAEDGQCDLFMKQLVIRYPVFHGAIENSKDNCHQRMGPQRKHWASVSLVTLSEHQILP